MTAGAVKAGAAVPTITLIMILLGRLKCSCDQNRSIGKEFELKNYSLKWHVKAGASRGKK
jgi:hypothetical protein